MHASLIILALISNAEPEPDAAVRRRVLAATVRMRAGDRATATAVVVGRKDGHLYLLTADHATDGPDTTALTFEFFADGKPEPAFALKGAKAALRRPVADFALLKVAVPADRTVAILPLIRPGKQAKRFPFDALSVGCSSGDPPTCERESIAAKRLAVRREDEAAFFWQAEKTQSRGRSGGPLVDAGGRVIGICAATALGKGYSVHASELHAALKGEGFGWLWEAAE